MINYVNGDATLPTGSGNKLIVHIVNDLGKWGNGFVVALSKRWKMPELAYREWYKNKSKNDFISGAIQVVAVEPDIHVVNMIAQHGISMYIKNGIVDEIAEEVPPIRYDALHDCLSKVCAIAKKHNMTVHGPRFGAGLAGGDWTLIEKIINDELISNGVSVTIYDLPKKHHLVESNF